MQVKMPMARYTAQLNIKNVKGRCYAGRGDLFR